MVCGGKVQQIINQIITVACNKLHVWSHCIFLREPAKLSSELDPLTPQELHNECTSNCNAMFLTIHYINGPDAAPERLNEPGALNLTFAHQKPDTDGDSKIKLESRCHTVVSYVNAIENATLMHGEVLGV